MVELRARREAAGLTQAQLAKLSGVAQPNIAAYESGRRPLSEAMARRLARAMVRPSDLVALHRDAIHGLVRGHRAHNPRVFGSIARGDDHPGSDVDMVVSFDDEASLFDLAGLHLALEELLGTRVDVIDEGGLRAKHQHILDDLVAL